MGRSSLFFVLPGFLIGYILFKNRGAISSSAHFILGVFCALFPFIICYCIIRDHSKGTNYHKILEYLSTGKIVISNNITVYKDKPNFVQMPFSRENNKGLPGIFRNVLKEIDLFNEADKQLERQMFAIKNSYENQILRIEEHINK